MSKFTNKYGAHKAIVRAIEKDDHIVNGDISTTQIIAPPMARYLRYKYAGDERIKPDIRDMFWALFGTITHEILERGNNTYREYYALKKAAAIMKKLSDTEQELKAAAYVLKFAESKFAGKIDKELFLERNLSWTFEGVTISGTQDIYHAGLGVLEDWKTCKTNHVMYYESDKREWVIQQNIYAWMLRRHGYKVNKIRILAIFRDWTVLKAAERDGKYVYPDAPWLAIELPIWSDEKVEAYLSKRLYDHFPQGVGTIVEPRQCSASERWSQNDEFAVMDIGRTRAIKKFDDRQMAQDFIDEYGFKYKKPWIEDRWGFDLKCKHFCAVAPVCAQFQERKDNQAKRWVKSKGRKEQNEKMIKEHYGDKEADLVRDFDADKFLKKKHNSMREFRDDNKELYKEEFESGQVKPLGDQGEVSGWESLRND